MPPSPPSIRSQEYARPAISRTTDIIVDGEGRVK
jgi:ParB-like chromosome segregation protein Spo0J